MAYLKSELSEKSKYWIPKHRYYELKHYCLQYKHWWELYVKLQFKMEAYKGSEVHSSTPGNPTEKQAIAMAECKKAMELVEKTARDTCKDEPILAPFLLKSVTEALPYYQLKPEYEIPCGRDMFYELYRRFFYILSQRRGI